VFIDKEIVSELIKEKRREEKRVLSWSNSTERQRIKEIANASHIPVTLIHVGKTGGGSVKTRLMEIFPLFNQKHLGIPNHKGLRGRHLIMVLRDPLERFASAYKWSKFRGEHFIGGATSKKIWDCFPTLSEFGEHCLDDTPCGHLLQRELMPNSSTYHMGMGYRYYLQNVDLDDYVDADHKIHIIDSERMNEDFNEAVSFILKVRVNITLPQTHSKYPQKNDSIPEKYFYNVKELLREEYRMYEELKRKYGN